MSFSKSQLIVFGVVGGIIVVFGLMFAGVIPGLQKKAAKVVPATNLTFWGLESKDTYQAFFNNPLFAITYKQFSSYDEYESALIDALAAGNGPDIFILKNGSLGKYQNKISPLSSQTLPLSSLQQYFPQVVAEDFVVNGTTYALPLSIDTLAMFYNRSLIDQARLTLPNTWTTWDAFTKELPKLVEIQNDGTITRAGAALGTSEKNITNASDIVNLFMLQAGTTMTNANGAPIFASGKEAQNALAFYTRFSNPADQLYTWNNAMSNSLDAFANEQVAVVFGYHSSLKAIREKNAFMDIGVAPIPQLSLTKQVAQPSYFGYSVTKQSKNPAAAWSFILSIVANEANAKKYSELTQQPPALRSLIQADLTNQDLGVFASQALIAHSWQKTDPKIVSNIFSEMIDSIVDGKVQIDTVLNQAQNKVSQLKVTGN